MSGRPVSIESLSSLVDSIPLSADIKLNGFTVIDEECLGLVRVYRWSKRQGLVGDVYVQPECRGQGVALALLQAAIAEARRQGLRRLWLYVVPTNTPAIRLYERLGFQLVARPPQRLAAAHPGDYQWYLLII
jgi:ribosomal protein S18 acetylase RimI-like enzyme